jgi:hypothetical protein
MPIEGKPGEIMIKYSFYPIDRPGEEPWTIPIIPSPYRTRAIIERRVFYIFQKSVPTGQSIRGFKQNDAVILILEKHIVNNPIGWRL